MRIWLTKKTQTGLLCSICLLFCLASYVLSEKGPRIKFKEETWDFGKVKLGDVLTYEFVFKNEGDTTLTIKNVTTSCGCTAALVSEKKINPQEEGKIKVTFNTQGYGGRVDKQIYVESDDPAEPRKQLTLRAEIEVPPQPKIELDRYNLDVGLVLEGEKIQGRLKIKNKGELELSVDCSSKNASFFSEGKALSFPLRIASGKEVDVEIRIASQKKRGLLREYVMIQSNDPLRSSLSIYLSGYIITREQLKELFSKYKNILD